MRMGLVGGVYVMGTMRRCTGSVFEAIAAALDGFGWGWGVVVPSDWGSDGEMD
jgi:hypothetical protein